MSLTTEQSGILANIAIDEYVAACHAGSDRQTVEFLSTLYVLVAQRMKDTGDGDAELVMDSNTAKPEQQRELAGPLAMGQPLGGGENAEPSNPKTQGRQHVATVVGADEYGPMLEWSTHWVELIGAKLYTRPQPAAQVAQPLTEAELHLCREWFNNVQDVNGGYLNPADYVLAEKIYKHLGMRVPDSISHIAAHGIGKDKAP